MILEVTLDGLDTHLGSHNFVVTALGSCCEVTLIPIVVLGDWSRRVVFGCWMFLWVVNRSLERRSRE